MHRLQVALTGCAVIWLTDDVNCISRDILDTDCFHDLRRSFSKLVSVVMIWWTLMMSRKGNKFENSLVCVVLRWKSRMKLGKFRNKLTYLMLWKDRAQWRIIQHINCKIFYFTLVVTNDFVKKKKKIPPLKPQTYKFACILSGVQRFGWDNINFENYK